jgi:hypothetical protein
VGARASRLFDAIVQFLAAMVRRMTPHRARHVRRHPTDIKTVLAGEARASWTELHPTAVRTQSAYAGSTHSNGRMVISGIE